MSASRQCAWLGSACVLALGMAVAMTASAAADPIKIRVRHKPTHRQIQYVPNDPFGSAAADNIKIRTKHKPTHRHVERVPKDPFGDIPKGPLQIFVSINQQQLHLYSSGVHVADALVATGVPGHLTPLGVFSIIEKDRYHQSNIYSGAPMPYMQRITWSGVALHEGPGVGRQASHGCIRMPHEFAARLWLLTRLGARVIIAGPELKPTAFADPHLFVHKQRPAASSATLSPPVQTAQATDTGTTTDAVETAAVSGAPVPKAVTLFVSKSTEPAVAALSGMQKAAAPPAPTAPVIAALEDVPLPLAKPLGLTKSGSAPVAIFISRRSGRIYVRQDFTPVFEAPVAIADQERPLGTHVFTAMNYLDDGATFRWTVVSLPGDQPKAERRVDRHKGRRSRAADDEPKRNAGPPPPETPQDALARIEIPQDIIDQISALIVPGSSLVISDQGLGNETGEGTDFIVVTR
jgi:hypothetical protein